MTGAIAAVVLVGGTGIAPVGAGGVREVRIEDRCDAATFPAEAQCGPVVDDPVTFEEFLAELNPDDFGHDHWRFHFGRGRLDRGEALVARNTGGEAHTFTEVAEFGGGCVPDLNVPLELEPVAECFTDPPIFLATLVLPGDAVEVSGLSAGSHKFMCLIHPWMRQVIAVGRS